MPQVGAELPLVLRHRTGQAAAFVEEPCLCAGVGGDVEEPLKELPPGLDGGPQERREVALGE